MSLSKTNYFGNISIHKMTSNKQQLIPIQNTAITSKCKSNEFKSVCVYVFICACLMNGGDIRPQEGEGFPRPVSLTLSTEYLRSLS